MIRRTLPVAAVLALAPAFQAFAQPASRIGRAIENSKPLSDPENEARRQKQIDAAQNQPRVVDNPADQELLRMPQGYYIIAPDKYRPDNWSPRIRLRRDYSGQGFYRGSNGARYSHRSGGYAPAYDYGCYGGGPAYYAGPDAFADAYEQGRYDADHEYNDFIAAQRAARLLDGSKLQLSTGFEHFQKGRYDRAAIEWLGASKRNEGDAASRVHGGHALFAVGRYDEAVRLIARGFELAPLLAEANYDVRTDYANPADFENHLNTLKAYVAANPNDASATTLLGYVLAYTDGPAAANPWLERANQLNPNDFFIQKLLTVSRMVTPQSGVIRSIPSPHSVDQTSGQGESRRPGAAPSNRREPSAIRGDGAVIRRVAYRTSHHD